MASASTPRRAGAALAPRRVRHERAVHQGDRQPGRESGWGFEFTFRITRGASDSEPPVWAASLLQNLARYVVSSGNWFEPGHHINANGPIRQDYPTKMTALAFAEDPELATIATPHGRVQFLPVVGLTSGEYEAACQWDTHALLRTDRR